MAKKTAKTKRKGGFKVTMTNLKFIGAAFDLAIADLEAMKVDVRDKKALQRIIDNLSDYRNSTAQECPQSWWIPYDVA